MYTLGSRVEFLRKNRGLTIKQLADELRVRVTSTPTLRQMYEEYGLSNEEVMEMNDQEFIEFLHLKKINLIKSTTSATISNIENNKHSPNGDLIVALGEYFDVSTDWLLTGKEKDKDKDLEFMAAREESHLKQIKEKQQIIDELILHLKFINTVSHNVVDDYENHEDSKLAAMFGNFKDYTVHKRKEGYILDSSKGVSKLNEKQDKK